MACNLQSLITILEHILNPQQAYGLLDDNKHQLQSLLQRSTSLQQILEKTHIPKLETLETQIREALHRAEDVIESYMVDQKLSCSSVFPTSDLDQVIHQLDSAVDQVTKLVEGVKKMSSGSTSSSASSSTHDPSSKSSVVGVDEDLLQLKDRLTGMERKLEIVPIVGMGGIGKTTLARNLYNDPPLVSHFDCLAWATISQDYNMEAILSELLRCTTGNESGGLQEILHKRLYGRRYLIVLDDVWSTKFWDEIRRFFPDNENGSRIVITTRELDVAEYAASQDQHHQVQLLSKSDSWRLLSQSVFGDEDCPDVLQGIGEKIASDCGGLPLAISVVGGILSKLERSKDVWENIGYDVRDAIAKSDEHFSDILSLSYEYLPNHLKPCFLYMGAFPEDYDIEVSKVVRMWMAEGFVKSNRDKDLEEEAEGYLKGLVDRNLVLVQSMEYNGKAESCSMHDLMRDLCVRKAEEEKFLCVVSNASEVSVNRPRRVSIQTSSDGVNDIYNSAEMMSVARSFLCTSNIVSPDFSALRLLRVLDVYEMKSIDEFPIEILQLVNLRYLDICFRSRLPIGISRLGNLQTLIGFIWDTCLPCEIWEMRELRHLVLYGRIWFDDEDYEFGNNVLNKLHTLSMVRITPSVIRRGFFKSIPNIRVLSIYYEDDELPSSSFEIDLSHLHKLQTLTLDSDYTVDYFCWLSALRFPSSLRKLNLIACEIIPSVWRTLCALPNLEVLSLNGCELKRDKTTTAQEEEVEEDSEEEEVEKDSEEEEEEEEWCLGEDDVFHSLQFLSLHNMSVVHWRADDTNFPRLRTLNIHYCWKLKEIPSSIGDIPTLQLIHISGCKPSLRASALRIQEEQQSEYANYDLKVLNKLHTLSEVRITPSVIRRGFFKSIPNIRVLSKMYDRGDEIDLSHLHRLQTLTFQSDWAAEITSALRFPSSLRKLNLNHCVIIPSVWRTLCALPNLEALELQSCAFKRDKTTTRAQEEEEDSEEEVEKDSEEEEEEEWCLGEDDVFCSLQFLSLRHMNVVHWRADDTNFPRLRTLIIDYCCELEEIPSSIGDIPTLHLIHIYKCKPSLEASALEIQEEQQSEYANYDLKVKITSLA